ncbi:MAG: hypothetical protein ACYDBB_11775 [Armatimonadota bacterium]
MRAGDRGEPVESETITLKNTRNTAMPLSIPKYFTSSTRPTLQGWIDKDDNQTKLTGWLGNGRIGENDFYVIGEAPFTITHQPGKVTINTSGRRRILQMSISEDIVPAHLLPPKDSLPEGGSFATAGMMRKCFRGTIDIGLYGFTGENKW